jgi:hypothetical protein
MNRLQSELRRLYVPQAPAGGLSVDAAPSLIDPQGRVRALVLELARPASWETLGKIWRGVQADLELPAPAIAVSGTDGLQLWFSLAEPVLVPQASVFLEQMRLRYLPDIAAKRVGLMPQVDALPPREAPSGNWSAFVAADLAPLFADTPWLDIEPGSDGQADLLSRLQSIKPPAFEVAMTKLRPAAPPRAVAPALPQPRVIGAGSAPKRFLLQVMNDDTVALALRIEAAKALLPYADDDRPDPGA